MKKVLSIALSFSLFASLAIGEGRLTAKMDRGLPQQIAEAARTAQEEGNHAGALREYRRLLELYPNDAPVRAPIYAAMGEAAERAGDSAGAAEYKQAAVALDADVEKRAKAMAAGETTRGGRGDMAGALIAAAMQTAAVIITTRRQPMPPQGIFPPQGMPAGYPPQVMPTQGYPPQSYPPQGMPPQGPYAYPAMPVGQPGYQPPPAMPAYDPNAQYQPPSGYPPSGQPAMPPSGYPQSGQPAMPPSGYPPSGQPAMPPSGYPPSGQPAMPPSGYPQSGQPAMPPSGYPPSGQPAMPPSGYPPSGQPAMPPSGYPPSGQPAMANSGYPPSGQPAMPPGQPGAPQGYPPQGQPGTPRAQYQPRQGYPQQRNPYAAAGNYRSMVVVRRGDDAKPVRVVHDHSHAGDAAYFENGCGALISIDGQNLIFTPSGAGETALVIPVAEILEIRLNTTAAKEVGAFHIATRKGVYLHLASDSGSRDDARAMIESLRKQLGIAE